MTRELRTGVDYLNRRDISRQRLLFAGYEQQSDVASLEPASLRSQSDQATGVTSFRASTHYADSWALGP